MGVCPPVRGPLPGVPNIIQTPPVPARKPITQSSGPVPKVNTVKYRYACAPMEFQLRVAEPQYKIVQRCARWKYKRIRAIFKITLGKYCVRMETKQIKVGEKVQYLPAGDVFCMNLITGRRTVKLPPGMPGVKRYADFINVGKVRSKQEAYIKARRILLSWLVRDGIITNAQRKKLERARI